ncbi:indolepyruvate oxidoreductase subunit beta [uncultured Mitsuokella sp.]|uniref:indolepyruvate oxidoreductase subunit beta n=1 Tax=uncultured Mitsuokella sp. TaxID=453120 RepID=UPI0025F45EFE|nr:indolepyruvate oxidoreductase subunit beta [uncultured Mitsuokella sp.]
MQKNIILTGVGGQGTVLASKLIAAASMNKGLPVMSAETIGMAQKGGSVFSHLRVGEGVRSPMIRRGTADLLLAFEPAEAVRMLPYLKKGGTVVVNSHPIMPVTAALKGTDYNGTEMVEYLREHTEHVLVIDGQKAAAVIGNPKTLNVIMLGAALESGALDFLTEEDVLQAIRQKVKPAYVALNEKALRYAFSLAAE